MRLQLMLMSAKLKIVRLQFRNGAIWALIALFLANQIAPIVHDFKMNIINIKITLTSSCDLLRIAAWEASVRNKIAKSKMPTLSCTSIYTKSMVLPSSTLETRTFPK